MDALWAAALPLLRQQVGDRNFNAWIEPIHCGSDDSGLRLEVPSRFFENWITRNYLPAICATITQVAGGPCPVRTVVSAAPAGAARPAAPAPTARREAREPREPREPKIGRLIAAYTFDSFVVGATNEVAVNAVRAVSTAPGRRYNPVFVHGGVGLGKTHLINAAAHELLRRCSRLLVACLPGEAFMNDFIASIRQNQMAAFRDRFRRLDALILDDVQFLAGKEQTQEELFHTFNALHGSGKQIVLTSDKPPAAIAGLEPRLRSRFEGGLIVDIFPPTPDMRRAIVVAKARSQGVELSPEVAQWIAVRSGTTVRELEGALTSVTAAAALRRTPITVALAEQVLGPFVPVSPIVTVERIQEVVGGHFQIPVEELISHQRTRRVTLPRQIAMYLSRTAAAASYPDIGDKFGGRDHATVMHAVRVIETKRAADAALDRLVAALDGHVRAG